MKEKRELLCEICDREYTVWCTHNILWNFVMREGKMGNPDRFSFVCMDCFAIEAEKKMGIKPTAWILSMEELMVS